MTPDEKTAEDWFPMELLKFFIMKKFQTYTKVVSMNRQVPITQLQESPIFCYLFHLSLFFPFPLSPPNWSILKQTQRCISPRTFLWLEWKDFCVALCFSFFRSARTGSDGIKVSRRAHGFLGGPGEERHIPCWLCNLFCSQPRALLGWNSTGLRVHTFPICWK